MNITWDEIFQFCMLVVAVINLVLQVKNKEKQPPNFPKSGYFSVTQGEPTYWQHPLYLYYTSKSIYCQRPRDLLGPFLQKMRFPWRIEPVRMNGITHQ